jgi:hypothetical protein
MPIGIIPQHIELFYNSNWYKLYIYLVHYSLAENKYMIQPV